MIRIGRLEIDLQRRVLRSGAEVLRLGSRAFDILEILVAARGCVVTKDQLIRQVWPDTIVEENNLQVHLSALRKALGADRGLILTAPGRGYRFVGTPDEPQEGNSAHETGNVIDAALSASYQPPHTLELYGRAGAIEEVTRALSGAAVVTLVGAGGIGKTSLAKAVARVAAARFMDGVRWVDLAPLTDDAAVLVALAEALKLNFTGGVINPARIADALASQEILVVMDNAEHVLDVTATVINALIRRNPRLRILATSREPLRIPDECLYRVDSLDVPPVDSPCQDVLTHSSVRLFFARVRAIEPRLREDARSVSLVGEICRRLDGIPLAIELAAARAATLGIEALLYHLDDRLRMLTGGHRTALPRHQTLRAMFDWSYALLDAPSRAVFRRLGRFSGHFTLERTCAVVADESISRTYVVASISDLVSKSLVLIDVDAASPQYRLPESTRFYALDKLREEDEEGAVTARLIALLTARLPQTRLAVKHDPCAATLSELREDLDDARAALDWAFSPGGDAILGMELSTVLVEAQRLLDAMSAQSKTALVSEQTDGEDGNARNVVDISRRRARRA
jgi:predicted ATPase/DNA-binding winged helix-turn-helix (wHTH) protein